MAVKGAMLVGWSDNTPSSQRPRILDASGGAALESCEGMRVGNDDVGWFGTRGWA